MDGPLPYLFLGLLEVEDGPALRVVERGRAVEGAEEERRGQHARHRLQAQAPSQRPERKKNT